MSETIETYHKILNEMRRYVQRNAVYRSQRDFGDALDNDNAVRLYQTVGDCADKMEILMMNNEIPFVRLQNKTDQFLIPDNAEIEQKVIDLNRDALEQDTCYCQEASAEDLEKAIARLPQIKDKGIITLDHLTPAEYATLRKECGKIREGFLFGSTKFSDGTYRVSVHAPDVFKEGKGEVPDFSMAWLLTVLAADGDNQKTTEQMLKENLQAMDTIRDYEGDTPKFITNSGRGGYGHLIQYDKDSVKVFNAVPDADGIAVEETQTLDKKDAGFLKKLCGVFEKMGHKNLAERKDVTQNLLGTISEEDRNAFRVGFNVRDIAMIMNDAIRERMKTDGMTSRTAMDVQFKQYSAYASEILEGAATGEYPTGPFSDVQNAIQQIMSEAQLNTDAILDRVCDALDRGKENVLYKECDEKSIAQDTPTVTKQEVR